MIIKKSPAEIEKMAAAGAILVRTMDLLAGRSARASPRGSGQGGREVHPVAGRHARLQGLPRLPGLDLRVAEPHGRARHPRQVQAPPGDVLSVDIGVVYDGWVADAARTFPVGPISPVAEKLLEVTEGSLFKAVEQCRIGNKLGDVSHAVQEHVEGAGLSVVRSLVGHGIGRDMHEEPQIPNYGPAGKGIPLEEGMVLAVEPMVTAGRHAVRMGDDGWAIYSQDGSLAAHFEFTIAITADGPRILTPWHESKAAAAA